MLSLVFLTFIFRPCPLIISLTWLNNLFSPSKLTASDTVLSAYYILLVSSLVTMTLSLNLQPILVQIEKQQWEYTSLSIYPYRTPHFISVPPLSSDFQLSPKLFVGSTAGQQISVESNCLFTNSSSIFFNLKQTKMMMVVCCCFKFSLLPNKDKDDCVLLLPSCCLTDAIDAAM